MHDIGNAINRTHHAEYGALLANDLLKETNISLEVHIKIHKTAPSYLYNMEKTEN